MAAAYIIVAFISFSLAGYWIETKHPCLKQDEVFGIAFLCGCLFPLFYTYLAAKFTYNLFKSASNGLKKIIKRRKVK